MGWREDAFEVPGESGNGRTVVKFCTERVLCEDKTFLEHKGARVKGSRWNGGKNMVDLMLVKKDKDGMRPLKPLCCTV